MTDSNSTTSLPLEIDVVSVKEMLDQSADFLLLDCREPQEHALCKIESAVLIPMNQTPDRISELEDYRDRRIVVHCHLGMRSLQVAGWLRQHGFDKAQNMSGGIEAWSLQIDVSVPRY